MDQIDTPLLLTIWNRPNKTNKLIKALRDIKPKLIYVAGDGPRVNNKEDIDNIKKTRKIIHEDIDWECTIKKKFNKSNMGCRLNMINSINWIFSEQDRAIIIEDDCIPTMEFFIFCKSLLAKYEFDKDIWNINGTNLQDGNVRGHYSYYFSKYFHSWGWATWKDRWLNIDENLVSYEDFKKQIKTRNYFFNKAEENYWIRIWDQLKYKNKPDSWAYRWLYTCISNNGINITPNKNLVKNIGFDKDATNTKLKKSIFIFPSKQVENYSFNQLKHPTKKIIDLHADKYTFRNSFKISFLKKTIILINNPSYYIDKFLKLIKKNYQNFNFRI